MSLPETAPRPWTRSAKSAEATVLSEALSALPRPVEPVDPACAGRIYADRVAAALAYGKRDAAPRVVAKGRGALAEEIVRRAREAGVFVHESKELVSLLMQVDLDRHIPAQLYVAVAELLAWLHSIENGGPLGTPSAEERFPRPPSLPE
jgi:flagellar biosynthesis protein